MPDNIPVEVVEHRLSEEERVCPQCGERMREIGTEVRETLKLIRLAITNFCVMIWAIASGEAKLPGSTDGSFGAFMMDYDFPCGI